METKQTDKELEQKIKALEDEAVERKRAETALRKAHTALERHAEDQNAELAKTVRRLTGEIKARDRAERKLKESDKRYSNLLNISLVGIYQSSIKGDILHVNEALARIFGFGSPEEMLLESAIVRYKHAEDRDVLIQSLKGSGSLKGFEFEALTKSGETKNIRLSSVLEGDTISGMIMDITDRKKSEKALRESEERYRSLFRNNHSVMLLIDPESADIVDANPAAVSFYGWSFEALTGKKITDINTLSNEQVFQEMGKAKTEQRRIFYFQHLLANGEIRDVEVFSGPIKVHGRELLYSIVHDVSKRKRAEAEVRNSEEKYRLLVKNIPGIVYKGFKDWFVEFYDNKIEHLTGFNIQKFKSGRMKWTDLMVMDDIEPAREIFIRALKTDKSYVRDYRIKTQSNDILWIQERGQIVCDDKGKIEYVSGVFFDITETKKALVALQEREATLKSIFRAAPIGIGMVCDRVVKQANKYMFEMVGYSQEELLGKSARLLYLTDEDFEFVGSEKYAQIHKHGIGTLETRLQRKDGKVIDVLLSSAPIDPNDFSKGITFAALNITNRKKAEAALRKSEEKYRRLYKLMRLMADNIPDLIWAKDMDGRYMFVNQAMCDKMIMCGCPDKAIGMTDMVIAEQERNAGSEHTFGEIFVNSDAVIQERKVACRILEEGFVRDKYLVLDVHKAPFLDENKEMIGTVGCGRDVTNEKRVEKALKEREIELERKNLRLEELNSALKILLEKRDGDKKVLEEKVLMNIKNLITPYVAKLKKTALTDRQDIFVEIIQSNIDDILSPFAHKLSYKYLNFTPTELQVADLVKQGLRTKEIAELLNSSPETVSGHRKSLRKKLNLIDKKSNLRTHLLSLG